MQPLDLRHRPSRAAHCCILLINASFATRTPSAGHVAAASELSVQGSEPRSAAPCSSRKSKACSRSAVVSIPALHQYSLRAAGESERIASSSLNAARYPTNIARSLHCTVCTLTAARKTSAIEGQLHTPWWRQKPIGLEAADAFFLPLNCLNYLCTSYTRCQLV